MAFYSPLDFCVQATRQWKSLKRDTHEKQSAAWKVNLNRQSVCTKWLPHWSVNRQLVEASCRLLHDASKAETAVFETAAHLAHLSCQLIDRLTPSTVTQPKYLAGCQRGIFKSHSVEAFSRQPTWLNSSIYSSSYNARDRARWISIVTQSKYLVDCQCDIINRHWVEAFNRSSMWSQSSVKNLLTSRQWSFSRSI